MGMASKEFWGESPQISNFLSFLLHVFIAIAFQLLYLLSTCWSRLSSTSITWYAPNLSPGFCPPRKCENLCHCHQVLVEYRHNRHYKKLLEHFKIQEKEGGESMCCCIKAITDIFGVAHVIHDPCIQIKSWRKIEFPAAKVDLYFT